MLENTTQFNVAEQQEIIQHLADLDRGIRPEGMDFEKFRKYRKIVGKMNKHMLSGQLVHMSGFSGMAKGMGKTYIRDNGDSKETN